jgi:nucleotide-binding universal stress UspA family protein
MSRIRRILRASDFSKASGPAFAKALEMASANRAELLLLHVLPLPIVPTAGDGFVSPRVYQDIEASARAYGRKQLQGLVTRARKAGVQATPFLAEGIPHDQITRIARNKRTDLIVIGTHGRTGLARLLLGSVAARAVTTAPCPVMTVRGR